MWLVTERRGGTWKTMLLRDSWWIVIAKRQEDDERADCVMMLQC